MFYDQHLLGEFNNGAVNAPPWNVRLSVVQPQGPFSDPYRGRTDFDLVTPASIGSPTAPFPRPVLVESYDQTFTTPLTYNWNVALEREVLGRWLARAAYVGSSSRNGRTTINLNPARYIPGASTTGNTDARRLFAPEYGNHQLLRAGPDVEVQLDAAHAEPAVHEWLHRDGQLHAGKVGRELRRPAGALEHE